MRKPTPLHPRTQPLQKPGLVIPPHVLGAISMAGVALVLIFLSWCAAVFGQEPNGQHESLLGLWRVIIMMGSLIGAATLVVLAVDVLTDD